MKFILKGLLTVGVTAMVLAGCTSTPQKSQTISTPHGQRIYIPEEKIGVRIENDIVITKNGFDDLMATIPVEVEEIEQLMNKK